MKIENIEKLVANLHDKKYYATQVLKKVHRVIKFN